MAGQFKELNRYLGLADQITLALEQLSEQLFQQLLNVVQEKLTIALQEILDQPIKFRATADFKRGAATVELAVLLPLLAFLCVIAVDFARVFYFSQTIANCARNGALYASDVYVRAESPYKTLEEAALADATDLSDPANRPTVTQSTGYDANGHTYVEVTVRYQFQTISNFPGVPRTMALQRTVRVTQAPLNPKT